MGRDHLGQMGRDHNAAIAVPHHHIAREHRRIAAGDRAVEDDRLGQRQVGGCRWPRVVGADAELSGLARIAEAAFSRPARIAPAEAALTSLRRSITPTAPAGHSSISLRCGWSGAENIETVQRLSRRDGAQRHRFADPARLHRVQRLHALDASDAKVPFKERGGDRGGADPLRARADFRPQLPGLPPPALGLNLERDALRRNRRNGESRDQPNVRAGCGSECERSMFQARRLAPPAPQA